MIKSILFLSALLGVQTMPVHTDNQYVGQQERQYQHTEDIGGNTEVTYKYESNEVNSIDDLVDGNIYQIDLTNIPDNVTIGQCYYVYGYVGVDSVDNIFSLGIEANDTNSRVNFFVSSNTVFAQLWYNGSVVRSESLRKTTAYFVYKTGMSSSIVNLVSYTDFNVIVDVTYNAPTSLFGLMADFFDQYIYSGIPHINDINYEVNGTTITMKDWLVVSTTIAVVILFLFILFFIFRWLIRTFSNAFLWR